MIMMNATALALNIICINLELAFSRNFHAVFSRTDSQLMFQIEASKSKYIIFI